MVNYQRHGAPGNSIPPAPASKGAYRTAEGFTSNNPPPTREPLSHYLLAAALFCLVCITLLPGAVNYAIKRRSE